LGLRLILGRAGAGKTRLCLDEIRARLRQVPDGDPLILLVPEQATFQTEFSLACTGGLGGFIRAHILSFRRLAVRILQETGGACHPRISEIGKRIALRLVLEKHRAELKYFTRLSAQPGFCDILARTLSELKFYNVSPRELLAARESIAGDPLADKLGDLATVWTALGRLLEGRYSDPDDFLALAADRASEATICKDAEIWVDGFSGFTPQEYAILHALALNARRLSVALCLDPGNTDPADESDAFYPTRCTYRRLIEMASRAGVRIEEPVMLSSPARFLDSPVLRHLESSFYRRPSPAYESAPAGIRLVAGANRRAEVEAAAREIISLARDRGYRWREINVVLRDIEQYHDLIACVFSDYGIPFFIDRKRPVGHHPLIELISSALEVAANGWPYDAVFRFLKTDLVPVTREEVDLLENYVLAHGIKEGRWLSAEPWPYLARRSLDDTSAPSPGEEQFLARINDIRTRATRELIAFCKEARNASSAAALAESLFKLLEALDVPARLALWAKAAENSGRLEESLEHKQIWERIVQLLDQLVLILGETHLSLQDLVHLIGSAVEGIRLGMIPPGIDQVLVAALDRSRNPEIKACFVLGANDGVLPMRPPENGLFTEHEQERLRALGLELSPSGRQRVFEEQYLVYIALTRASEYLWVSYPMSDAEGRALSPSRLLQRLKELFPQLREDFVGVEPASGDVSWICCPERTMSYVIAALRSLRSSGSCDPIWLEAYNWFLAAPQWSSRFKSLLASLTFYNNEKSISPVNARRLYRCPIRLSVSQVERFQACHFAHFLSHGLRLRERLQFSFAAPELGDFLHIALKMAGELVRDGQDGWEKLDHAAVRRLASQVLRDLAPRFKSEILFSTARFRYLRQKLQRTLERSLWLMAEHCRRGAFTPVAFEIGFGPGEVLPPIRLKLGDGEEIELQGRIDRIDMAVGPSGNYLRVIDYKTGRVNPDLNLVAYGLQLQLLAYLDVVITHAARICGKPALPAGILYFSVSDPFITAPGPLSVSEAEKKILAVLKLKGFVLADPEVVRMMDRRTGYLSEILPVGLKSDGSLYPPSAAVSEDQFNLLRAHVQRVFTAAGKAMLDGVVEINPYDGKSYNSCRYCPYRPVCHFDPLLPGNEYRRLSAQPDSRFWLALAAAGGDGN